MSEEDVKAQEGAEESGEEKGTPGDEGKYASKEEMTALQKSVEGMATKSDQLYKIMTSDAFMNRGAPAPPPVPVQPKEKEPSQADIDDYTPTQLTGHILGKISGILEKQGLRQTENLNKM